MNGGRFLLEPMRRHCLSKCRIIACNHIEIFGHKCAACANRHCRAADQDSCYAYLKRRIGEEVGNVGFLGIEGC